MDNPQEAAGAFADQVRSLNLACNCRKRTIVVIVDQFEELLSGAQRPSCDRFLRFLQALLSGSDRRLQVIGTMRSDYLDVYHHHPQALKSPYFKPFDLPPFPWERVADIIVKPAARVGVTFESNLLKRLELDAPNSDAMPLLAFTLEKLFRECAADGRIKLEEYDNDQFGRMTKIEQAVKKIVPSPLPPETEQALRLAFVRHLVDVNKEGNPVRQAAAWSKLPSLSHKLLKDFVSQGLLHASGDGETATVEVSHEALFRVWKQLEKWLAESDDLLRWRRYVELNRKDVQASGLRGHRLDEAAAWLRTRPDELEHDEKVLIRNGLNLRWTRRGLFASVGLLVVAMALLWQHSASNLRVSRIEEGLAKETAKTEKAEAKRQTLEARAAGVRNAEELGRQDLVVGDASRALFWLDRAYTELASEPSLTPAMGSGSCLPVPPLHCMDGWPCTVATRPRSRPLHSDPMRRNC